jgi:hypothetical protein
MRLDNPTTRTPADTCQHVLNDSAKSLIFESLIPRQSLGLEIGGGCSAAAGAAGVGVVSRAESILGGSDHG